jgi:hypothetical protein
LSETRHGEHPKGKDQWPNAQFHRNSIVTQKDWRQAQNPVYLVLSINIGKNEKLTAFEYFAYLTVPFAG